VFYAACRRMVFGLSSSKPKRLTSDHLPSVNNLSQPARKKREQLIGQITADTEDVRDVSTPLDMTRSKRGWHRHEENRDHQERDKKFANHRTEISQQTPPAGPAGIYHSFAGDEFTGDRANHRSNK
jgi:hypothetical protein